MMIDNQYKQHIMFCHLVLIILKRRKIKKNKDKKIKKIIKIFKIRLETSRKNYFKTSLRFLKIK